uniref:Uncharacterized protein n=1 Tax=Anguilla anguilla TaxID=7936 RepID=A0A0E9X7M2_ANGAN
MSGKWKALENNAIYKKNWCKYTLRQVETIRIDTKLTTHLGCIKKINCSHKYY